MTSQHRARFGIALACAAALGVAAAGAHGADTRSLAYVSNQEGEVTVIDLATFEVVDQIDIEAKAPRGLGITDDGKLLVTANRDGADLSVIDTATRKVLRHIPIGKNPEFVRVIGKRAFVTFEPSAKGGPPPKPGQKEDDDEDKGPKEPARVAVVDLSEFKVLREITGGPETEGIEFSPDGQWVVVTNEEDDTVTAHEIATGKLVRSVDLAAQGKRPRGIKLAPDGKHYVVTLEYGDSFVVLDTELALIKKVATDKTPYGVAFDRSGKRLFVAAARAEKLQVFDGRSYAHIADIPIGKRCWHFTFTPDDRHLLVACGRSHEVLVVDAADYRLVKRLEGKNLPWGVVTYPKAPGSLDAPAQ